MVNYKKYKPVAAITIKGTLLVALIRSVFFLRKWIGKKQWIYPIPEHHEDPLTMNATSKVYLGYKYYYKAIVKTDEDATLETHFKNHIIRPLAPPNFIAQNTITLSAGGDLMPYQCINKKTCTHLWDEVGEFFFDSDIVFANLETPINNNKKASLVPEIMLYNMYFNGSEEMFNIFSAYNKYGKYDVVSIANNHSLDMGVEGLLNTMHFLKEKNIYYTGASLTKEERDHFPIIEKKGIKIAFLAYTFSLNMEQLATDEDWLCNYLQLNKDNVDISFIIHQAKLARSKGADIVVAALHMGCAYQAYPSMHTVNNIKRICKEANIDIILGGHPHNAQPMEQYVYLDAETQLQKQSFIFYSLGDFVAYDIFKWCHMPLIVKIQITQGLLNAKKHTIVSNIQVKPIFVQASKKNGKINSLQFRDLETFWKQSNTINKKENKELKELKYFLDEFIIPPQQKHLVI